MSPSEAAILMHRSLFEAAYGAAMKAQTHDRLASSIGDTHGWLSGPANLDQRKMLTPLFEVDDDLEARPSRSAPGRRALLEGPRLEAWSIASRLQSETDLIGCTAAKALVRPALVVPDSIQGDLASHLLDAHGHENSSERFVLQREKEAFDDSNAALLADGAEARSDAQPRAPLDVVGSELRASVRDDVLWRRARTSDGGVEQACEVARTGFFEENLKAEELSGKLVEHDGDVPGERPEGGQREGIPGGPQARGDWHDGGVAMPDV